jgi:hypothetical protein
LEENLKYFSTSVGISSLAKLGFYKSGYSFSYNFAACSSLQDLGVFISQNLTSPARFCGALGAFSDKAQVYK